PVNWRTILSLRPIIVGTSMLGPVALMPWSLNECVRLWNCFDESSSAFDGMQPTLRQGPPSAALPSRPAHASTQAGFGPGRRGADRRVIAGGTAADDDDVELVCHCVLPSSSFSQREEVGRMRARGSIVMKDVDTSNLPWSAASRRPASSSVAARDALQR